MHRARRQHRRSRLETPVPVMPGPARVTVLLVCCATVLAQQDPENRLVGVLGR